MAISIVDGKVPYYGIYNNSAKKASSVAEVNSKNFYYVAPWTVSFGNSEYYLTVEDNSIWMYKVIDKDNNSYSTYDKLERYKESADSTSYNFTIVRRALQPIIIFKLFDSNLIIGGDNQNCSVYYYDSGSLLFIHVDFYSGNSVEVVITSKGYIQYYQSKPNDSSNSKFYYSQSVIKTLFESNNNSCTNCVYKSNCSYSSDTRTSCGWGETYVIDSTDYVYVDTNVNQQSFLLIPPSETKNYTFTVSQTQCLGGTGLTESNGEVKVNTSSGLVCVPLKTSHTYPDVSVRVGGQTKYMPLGSDTSSQPYSERSPLRVRVGGSTLSPKIDTNDTYGENTFPFIYEPSDSSLRDYNNSSDIKIYTSGTPNTSGYRWFAPDIYTLPTKLRVSQITVFGRLFTGYSDETTTTNDNLPNASYPNTYMVINSSDTAYVNWTTNNTTNISWHSFEAGNTSSNGGRGKYVSFSFYHNDYIRQFCFVPACTVEGSTSYKWVEFNPYFIVFTDYSSGESYTYSV